MAIHLEDEASASPPGPALEYAKHEGPSRRQFSLLILLVFLNTLMFAAFVCLPAVTPAAKQAWADYQQRKAQKQKEQQRQAVLAQVKTYMPPANQVVYEEDPAEIQKLFAASTDWTTGRVQNNSAPEYPSDPLEPILRSAPQPLSQLQATANDMIGGAFAHVGIPFVHARQDPNGREHLVCVTIWPQVNVKFVRREESGDTYRYVYDLKRSLYFTAYAVPPDGSTRTRTIMFLDQSGDNDGRVMYTVGLKNFISGSQLSGGQPQTLHRSILRVLAGQPDASDPTHFSIPYILDGKPGVIDGFLRANGRVMLQPRDGQFTKWEDANTYRWELAAPPTTRPIDSKN